MRTLFQDRWVRFGYAVRFTLDLFGLDNTLLWRIVDDANPGVRSDLLVMIDRGLVPHYPDLTARIERYCAAHAATLRLAHPPLVIEGGERAKNDPGALMALYAVMQAAGLCRQSYLVAVGGGALLDLAGYAAATAHRGLRLIRVPTTALAQAGGALGLKNSLNTLGRKDFIGTFAAPFAVLNDGGFLTTLAERDWRAGLAAALQVAVVADAGLFAELERRAPALRERDIECLRVIVQRAAAVHLDQLAAAGDALEQGGDRPPAFGLWAAHKLEELTQFGLRHGEALAIGMAVDTSYAQRAGVLADEDAERILGLIGALGLPRYAPELSRYLERPDDPRAVWGGVSQFREHIGGPLRLPLLVRIGCTTEVDAIEYPIYQQAVRALERAALGMKLRSC